MVSPYKVEAPYVVRGQSSPNTSLTRLVLKDLVWKTLVRLQLGEAEEASPIWVASAASYRQRPPRTSSRFGVRR